MLRFRCLSLSSSAFPGGWEIYRDTRAYVLDRASTSFFCNNKYLPYCKDSNVPFNFINFTLKKLSNIPLSPVCEP